MSAPLRQEHLLTWGVLQLAGPATEDLFEITAMAGGTHFGNPTPIIEALPSLLVDGALAVVTGWENRDVPIRLRVSANDGERHGEAEAALFQQVQLDQPPPLVWTSPIGLSAVTVFDVVVAKLERDTEDGWDLREVLRGDRFYTLTLTCLPFVRAVESTVFPALPVPVDPTTPLWVVVDSGDSITGWAVEASSYVSGPTLVTSGGESLIQARGAFVNPGGHLRLVRTGAVDVDGNPYLALDVLRVFDDDDMSYAGHWTIRFDSGPWVTPLAVEHITVAGVPAERAFFATPASFSTLRVAFDITALDHGAEFMIGVSNIAYTDTLGSSGDKTTSRQQSRLATVLGSAPTQAAIRAYDATPANLGTDILVYTSRSQVQPNLRQWIASSHSAGTNAANVSGWFNTLATPTVIRIPANLLNPGTHALLARMDVDTAGTLTWQARMTTLDGATLVGSAVTVSGQVELAVTDGYEVVDLAAMILPVVEVAGTSYAVEITLSGTSAMKLDEAWLFNLDDGVLTWIRDTEGLDWVEIRSPELGAARPSVWGGRNAVGTGGSCIDWKCLSFGPHRFDPGTMQIFTVTTESLKSQCEIEFFPRFFGNVWGDGTS